MANGVPMRWPPTPSAGRIAGGMRCRVKALGLSMLLLLAGCPDGQEGEEPDADDPPMDVQAILWCVLSAGFGETADGEEVAVRTTSANRGACLCLPLGTQPFTGTELDELLHEMALDKCEEDLRALGAVTTNCAELVAERPVDYESSCEPDEWPPPPI
jgi:hypothetical protein